jgi:D-galactarolactone cycloisomerase
MCKHNIIKIEPVLLNDSLEKPFYFSQFEYKKREICIVKITTGSGYVGWGEGYGPGALVKAGIEYLSPFIIGDDVLWQERIWNKLYRRVYDYSRKGIFLSAISAIDIALWDLKGKILNQPISSLLGGRLRDSVQVYATGLYFSNENNMKELLVEEALFYKNSGFEAIKMKVGLGIEKDIQNVSAVRNALGETTDLMIDANHAYNLIDAKRLIRGLEGLNIGWFEEPLSNDDYAGYKELRKFSEIPVAGGECEYLKYGAMQLMMNMCVDIFQPDTCACGGITEVKKMMTLAECFYITLTPHNWGTGIAMAANLQLVGNIENTPLRLFPKEPLLEFDCSPNRLRDELLYENFSPLNGFITIPEKPGLGIEVDEMKIEEFKI